MKRTLKDIHSWLTAKEVYTLITQKSWPYKTKVKFYQVRDKALMSIDFVGAFRNHEVLNRIRVSSFVEEKAYWILQDAYIGKRTKKTIAKYGSRVTTREHIFFPKFQHPLQPFTDLLVDYLRLLEDDDLLFRFGERRHHQIVYYSTGMWPHWLRAMAENWYGHNVWRNDPIQLAKFIGVVNPASVMPYTGFDEEDYKESLKKSSFTDRK